MDYPLHGRTRSWVAVGVIITGFIIGGVALTIGPAWWLFWIGAGIAAAGGLAAIFSDILADVVLDEPRVVEEAVHYSLIGRDNCRIRGGAHGETATKPTASDPGGGIHG